MKKIKIVTIKKIRLYWNKIFFQFVTINFLRKMFKFFFGIHNMEIKETNGNKILKKYLPRFFCEFCDFKCYMKCDWTRHLTTGKHSSSSDGNFKKHKKLNDNNHCHCGKIFLTKSGLWKHSKKCIEEQNNQTAISTICDKELSDKELIMVLVKQNSELLEQNSELLEVLKNGTHVTNIRTNTSRL